MWLVDVNSGHCVTLHFNVLISKEDLAVKNIEGYECEITWSRSLKDQSYCTGLLACDSIHGFQKVNKMNRKPTYAELQRRIRQLESFAHFESTVYISFTYQAEHSLWVS
jgi:hypothetical protein